MDAFPFKDVAYRVGYVGVFTADQLRPHFDDGHLGAKAPIDLGELKPDIAAADDHQMLRHALELQNRTVGEVGYLVKARQIGHDRAPADIDEDTRRGQKLRAHPHLLWPLEPGRALENRAAPHVAQPVLDALAGVGDNRRRPAPDLAHVDTDRLIQHDAVVGAAPRQMCSIGAGDQRLGRHAARVDTGAAKLVALDQGDLHSARGEAAGERGSRLPRPDHDRIEIPGHLSTVQSR